MTTCKCNNLVEVLLLWRRSVYASYTEVFWGSACALLESGVMLENRLDWFPETLFSCSSKDETGSCLGCRMSWVFSPARAS